MVALLPALYIIAVLGAIGSSIFLALRLHWSLLFVALITHYFAILLSGIGIPASASYAGIPRAAGASIIVSIIFVIIALWF